MSDDPTKAHEKPPQLWQRPESLVEAGLTHPWFTKLLRLQASVLRSSRAYFDAIGYDQLLAPITTGAISSPMGLGSDSLPVRVHLGGRECYLADSMQFYLEYALRVLDRGVYYAMPCFRGEVSDARHLAEFFHIEAELDGPMDAAIGIAEGMLGAICRDLADGESMIYGDHVRAMAAGGPLPRVRWNVAASMLADTGLMSERDRAAGNMSNAAERELIHRFGGPVWLTHPPIWSVPFYQARCADRPADALSADLLMGMGETVGLGQRCATVEDLLASLADHHVLPDDYAWYLTMKRLRPRQTSGFGMGLERFLCWVLGHDDIRDMQLFLRVSNEPITF